MEQHHKMGLPLIIGISGASGAVYGVKILELLKETSIPVHLVMSPSAKRTLCEETSYITEYVQSLADVVHSYTNIGASIASGSFKTRGMIVIPCSVKTMSEIAVGLTGNLLSRSADVTLKERRPLIIVLRETPLHAGHLQTMLNLTTMGATIMPPVPAFYHKPVTVEEIVTQTGSRILDYLGIDVDQLKRWGI
jgi:flavin prenyltransferase